MDNYSLRQSPGKNYLEEWMDDNLQRKKQKISNEVPSKPGSDSTNTEWENRENPSMRAGADSVLKSIKTFDVEYEMKLPEYGSSGHEDEDMPKVVKPLGATTRTESRSDDIPQIVGFLGLTPIKSPFHNSDKFKAGGHSLAYQSSDRSNSDIDDEESHNVEEKPSVSPWQR